MVKKRLIEPGRVRRIKGSFGFIPHRFLTDGFLESLSHNELVLYFFLVLASDRYGLSYYSETAICGRLDFERESYLKALRGLIAKDLIAHDGILFQVLELPSTPRQSHQKHAVKTFTSRIGRRI